MKKTYSFDFRAGEFVLKNGKSIVIEGKEALKQWIEKILRTQKGRYKIYKGTGYGINIQDLIGQVYPAQFIQSELQRECESALLQNPDILSITEFSTDQDGSSLNIEIKLNTVYGQVTQEVTN